MIASYTELISHTKIPLKYGSNTSPQNIHVLRTASNNFKLLLKHAANSFQGTLLFTTIDFYFTNIRDLFLALTHTINITNIQPYLLVITHRNNRNQGKLSKLKSLQSLQCTHNSPAKLNIRPREQLPNPKYKTKLFLFGNKEQWLCTALMICNEQPTTYESLLELL